MDFILHFSFFSVTISNINFEMVSCFNILKVFQQ